MPAESTKPITPREAAAYTKRLRRVADAVDMIRAVLDESGTPKLWVFRKPSLEEGLRRIEAALPEIERSITSFQAGYPLNESTEKGRKKPDDDAMIAEGVERIKAIGKERRATMAKEADKKTPRKKRTRRTKKKGGGEE